jgi:SOS-response transcriptional repressor LexA
MKILIEGCAYDYNYLKRLFGEEEDSYFKNVNNKYKITHVGYFHKFTKVGIKTSSEIVYMLPKVFKEYEATFSRLNNIDDEKRNLASGFVHVKDPDQLWARKLTVYFYRGLKEYKNRITDSKYFEENNEQKALDLKTSLGNHEYTFMDLYLAFTRYYIKHKNAILFKHIQNISNQSRNPKWEKTIRRSLPITNQKKQLIYTEIRNKKKVVDTEEDLITMFVSIIHSFDKEVGLDFKLDSIYNIYKGASFNKLCDTGLVKLRKIKHKYFSDIMKGMYNLCEIYFKTKENSSASSKSDFLTVNKYNQVFEDMLDKLLVDNASSHLEHEGIKINDLKRNKDGKIIDHIYKDLSLLNEDKYVYFIADSKYYNPLLDNENPDLIRQTEGVALYKQFTYAKNIIQFNMDVFNDAPAKYPNDLFYRDELTEGYNITPNFFIYGYLNKNIISDYSNHNIEKNADLDGKYYSAKMQWKFRLFDRDTLFALHYKISFPYILKTYISKNISFLEQQRTLIKSKFRKEFISFINEKADFSFYSFKFASDLELVQFVNKNFREVIGKVIRLPNSENDNILFVACHKHDIQFNDFLNKELNNKSVYACEINTGYLSPPEINKNKNSIKVLQLSEVKPYINSVPLYDVTVAAGQFIEQQIVSDCEWVVLPEPLKASKDYFVCKVVGESMNKKIPNGSWCLFKKDPGGTRNGKIVLVQHQEIQDIDFITGITIKEYHSEKKVTEDNWEHLSILLKPLSTDQDFKTIVLKFDPLNPLSIIGEFVCVL